MNPVRFFENQVVKWNADSKCGFCFEFSAPLKNDALSKQVFNDPCCVQVVLTDLGFSNSVTRASTGFVTQKICDWSFNLWVVKPDDLGVNNYSESEGHPVSESKWERILNPLADCFGCDLLLDFCEFWDYPVQVTRWSGAAVINEFDTNLTGWKIAVSFRLIT